MYSVKLSRFEGPMDLLLHLIEKAEMDIRDIQVSAITAQYLGYMEQLDELEPDAASEFCAMASTLLLIKSRALLPKPQPVEEEDEDDPEVVLLRRIREYKLFKEVGAMLADMKDEAALAYRRLPDEFPLPPPVVEFKNYTADRLLNAFERVMRRLDSINPVAPADRVHRDSFMIGERMEYLSQRLSEVGRLSFFELFGDASSRIEVIVTFMALLELVASGSAHVEQGGLFDDITIRGRGRSEVGE